MRDKSKKLLKQYLSRQERQVVNTKEKEDSFMEEMWTKEKQIVYDQALYELSLIHI